MAIAKGGRRGVASPNVIEDTIRQTKAVELRLAGYQFEEICAHLGYANPGAAYNAIRDALKKSLREPTDEMRETEGKRLDKLLKACWAKALGSEKNEEQARFIQTALQIMDRRAKLFGLWTPVQVDIRLQLTQMAEALGFNPEDVIAEAERVIGASTKAQS